MDGWINGGVTMLTTLHKYKSTIIKDITDSYIYREHEMNWSHIELVFMSSVRDRRVSEAVNH